MRVEWVVSSLKRFQRDKFGQLTTQSVWVATEVMDQDLGRLLVLGEVPTLVKASSTRRVHEEIGWSVQFNKQTPGPCRHPAGIVCRVGVLERDVLDVGEWVLDFVPGRVIVDVVCKTSFVRRVENDQVHRILTHTAPRANA